MKLSERLKVSRINRPDEWSMDEYARQAEELETQLSEANAAIKEFVSQRGRLMCNEDGMITELHEKAVDRAKAIG